MVTMTNVTGGRTTKLPPIQLKLQNVRGTIRNFSNALEFNSLWKKLMTIRTNVQFKLPLTLLRNDLYGLPFSVNVLRCFTRT